MALTEKSNAEQTPRTLGDIAPVGDGDRACDVVNAENWANAAGHDYQVYQKFWLNLDVCADGFEAKMVRWLSQALKR